MPPKSSIYKIENILTGDVYVGSTSVKVERRWSNHLSDLRCGRHPNLLLQLHADLMGLACFKFTKIKTCKKEQKTYWEAVYIEQLNASYNIKLNKKELVQ